MRHVSLSHTDPRDGRDVEMPESRAHVPPHRRAPHGRGRWTTRSGSASSRRTPCPPSPSGAPCSCCSTPGRRTARRRRRRSSPRSPNGTLVTAEEVLARYPKIPGVNLPKGPSRLPRYDYGPDFDNRGIMSVFPPAPVPGQEYPIRVPQIDADGNTLAGLRYPDIEVPLGTYNGWSLRKAGYAEGDQCVEHRQLRPLRPHPGRARGQRRPAPLDRGALPEPRGLRRPRWRASASARERAADAPGGRRPLHRGGSEEQPARPGGAAGPADPGRGLHGKVDAAPARAPRESAGPTNSAAGRDRHHLAHERNEQFAFIGVVA